MVAQGLDYATGGTSTLVLTSPEFGAVLNGADQLFAGLADSVTYHLTTKLRSSLCGGVS